MKIAINTINRKGSASPSRHADPHFAWKAERQLSKTDVDNTSTGALHEKQYSESPAVRRILAALAGLDGPERAEVARVFAIRFVTGEVQNALAPKQAAARLGVGVSTVRAWCAEGRLGRRVGGRWWNGADELRAFVAGDPS